MHTISWASHAAKLKLYSLSIYIKICTECEYMIFGKHEYLVLGSSKRLCDLKVFFSIPSFCKYFCFSSFHPSLTWFAVAILPFIFFSLPPPFSVMAILWNRSPQPEKRLRGFRKLLRRSTRTRALMRMQIKVVFKRQSRRHRGGR